ncbi:MAG: class I SAM-dependent methyltransferase [Solirubrobacteraceae bacterium]
MSVRDWDAGAYDRISTPQQRWGADVLARMPLKGDELVLDAGCGTGRVTEMLLERVPRGRVIAVDSSPGMVEAARERLGERAEVRLVDLRELELQERVDAVLSTATFHWIADHDLLYRRLHAALRSGGRLVAQCGGKGNVQRVHDAAREVGEQPQFAEHFTDWSRPWNFTSPEQAHDSLLAAGFRQARCWLTPAPARPPEPRTFLATVILNPFLARLPAELEDEFLDQVHRRLGDPLVVDYVRLNIDATA